MEKYGVPLNEEHIMEQILYQTTSPNIELKTEFNIYRFSHSSTFDKVSTYFFTVVDIFYPSTNPSSGRFRKRGIYATGLGDHVSGRSGHFNV